nr:hypothetical protein [Actinosynnema mirum]
MIRYPPTARSAITSRCGPGGSAGRQVCEPNPLLMARLNTTGMVQDAAAWTTRHVLSRDSPSPPSAGSTLNPSNPLPRNSFRSPSRSEPVASTSSGSTSARSNSSARATTSSPVARSTGSCSGKSASRSQRTEPR